MGMGEELMRLHILIGIACLSLAFSACGKSDGTSDSSSDQAANTAGTGGDTSSKSIFSLWNEENNTFQLDFRSAQFGVSSVVYITSGTVGSCTCNVMIQGSQTAGTMVFSNCTNGSVACVSLRPSGSYTKSSSSLQLCTSTSCISMK
jgi:hypothetical protein